jgi:hypothetical protein
VSSSDRILRIQTPEVFLPFLKPSRDKAAYGGRGSGKSHFFAELLVEHCYRYPGTRAVCVREIQKSLVESMKRLIEDKISTYDLGSFFNPTDKGIGTRGGGNILFQGMQDHTAESIKSLEGYDIALIEEAQTLTRKSNELLRPTIRKPSSERWYIWNPRNAEDAVDKMFRGSSPPPNSIVVRTNWRDNPWFSDELNQDRLYDKQYNPQRYGHIWEGDYEPQAIGAIWSREVIERTRRNESPDLKRILVSVDPSISSEPGSDECGIIAGGIGEDQRGYVIGDYSRAGTPKEWAERAIDAYDMHDADAIVAEVNQGGEMVANTIRSVRPGVRIIEVRASRGKHIRAEPISALYGLGRISHVGAFPELERQMCLMTAEGYQGNGSPDRVDSLVWLFTELFPKMIRREHPTNSMPTTRANSRYNVLRHG